MADETLNERLTLDEIAPLEQGPKLALHVGDVGAYEAWLLANGWTLEEHAAHLTRMLTPGSFE